jgi:hypothetical protein
MSLSDYYKNLGDRPIYPKQEFREALMRETGKREATVYRWLNGTLIPGKLEREAIARLTNKSVSELFPESITVENRKKDDVSSFK